MYALLQSTHIKIIHCYALVNRISCPSLPVTATHSALRSHANRSSARSQRAELRDKDRRCTGPPRQQEISESRGRNLARQNPAPPLVHDASSLSSLTSIAASSMIRDTRGPDLAPDSRRVRKAASRQSRSCTVCRHRKVKVRLCCCCCCCAQIALVPGGTSFDVPLVSLYPRN